MENLTSEIENGVLEELSKIEKLGGALDAITSGYIQQEIRKSAYQHQRLVDSGERVVIGVNRFVDEEELRIKPYVVDPTNEETQVRRLREVKQTRLPLKVQGALRQLEKAAERDLNLMPHILTAVKAYATLGEVSDILRGIYGEYRPKTIS